MLPPAVKIRRHRALGSVRICSHPSGCMHGHCCQTCRESGYTIDSMASFKHCHTLTLAFSRASMADSSSGAGWALAFATQSLMTAMGSAVSPATVHVM